MRFRWLGIGTEGATENDDVRIGTLLISTDRTTVCWPRRTGEIDGKTLVLVVRGGEDRGRGLGKHRGLGRRTGHEVLVAAESQGATGLQDPAAGLEAGALGLGGPERGAMLVGEDLGGAGLGLPDVTVLRGEDELAPGGDLQAVLLPEGEPGGLQGPGDQRGHLGE